MSEASTTARPRTSRLARSRGALSGIMLVILGAWGALAPFIGPSFDFAFSPDKSWHWTAGRGWYEVLPGAVAFVGGLLLLFGASRFVTLLGAWLGVLAGAWFIVGPTLSTELSLGSIGHPIGSSSGKRIAEGLTFFAGLGALILFFGAAAFGRLSVVTLRDVRTAERREAERRDAEDAGDAATARRGDETDGRYAEDGRYADEGRGAYDREQYDRGAYDRERYEREGAAGRDGEAAGRDSAVTGQQQAPAPPPPGSGYNSALGYREGEPTTQYTPPSYGQHAAPPAAGTTGTTADAPPEERQR
jgi:hypothetical protein